MSNTHLRPDDECQNCGYSVDKAYCSNCGQKNIETRQSFGHLFTHFIEDLTHYDGAFWKTIKYLLFRPGRITIEYLEGHRMRYVPPVKLYIFISFVAFLLMSITNNSLLVQTTNAEHEIEERDLNSPLTLQGSAKTKIKWTNKVEYHSVKEVDSLQKFGPENTRLNSFEEKIVKNMIRASDKDSSNGLGKQITDGILHAAPKILFIYMPIFAFWLWLFHGKRRWLFFDHGIFTLHYFSVLLLLTVFNNTIDLSLSNLLSHKIADTISDCINVVVLLYSAFYFFRSHQLIYGENKWISGLKSLVLLIINTICLFVLIVAGLFYVLYNLH